MGSHCEASGCVSDSPSRDMSAATGGDLATACSPACAAGLHCNASHMCVACLADPDCPPGQLCKQSGATSVCVLGCMDDSRCAGDGTQAKCCGGQCVDTAKDPQNCGACGTPCGVQHSSALCTAGACTAGKCDPGWGDCNNDAKDGCETNLRIDANNCIACGMKCAFPHASAGCSDGCYVTACDFGYADCNNDADNKDGCEMNVSNDPMHCGDCSTKCGAVAHAKNACVNAACQLTSCDSGYLDCDGMAGNGCETAAATDLKNCGMCGNACAQGLACVNGSCTCQQCNIPHAKTKCVNNNQCVFDVCVAGFADCNNNLQDGCEVDLTADAKNCNGCGNLCPMNMPACVNSACTNADKCSNVATAYCKSKGWVIAPWQTSFPNQPGGSIFCVTPGNSAGADCDTCMTYNQLVWKNVAKDACGSGQMLMPGTAYGGHSPCQCTPNLLNCGAWPMMGCIPD